MALSYSQLQLYRTCPKQYEFAVVKKIPRQISAGESFGSSVHNTLKKWGEKEMENGKLKMKNDQQTLFEESKSIFNFQFSILELLNLWHSSFIVEGYESRLEADFARRRGERLLTNFYEWWQREPRTVLAVEKGFKVPMNDTTISGRFDRVEQEEEGVHVIDFKTSTPKSQDEVDADLQLSIYAIASEESLGQPCTKLTMLYLNEDALVERTTARSSGQMRDAQKQILSLCEQLEEKDYHPTPSREKCRACPYRGVCSASAI
ncbi:MAG: PD-(D/E)XK nuclease family protein [Candidatus Peribacteraceae bacterium]|nr:PD-(D/E)XK nuclease family protein [Candidatus Peribacteraceae bacterium]